jgi:predicted CXXCH cytochrome family protein
MLLRLTVSIFAFLAIVLTTSARAQDESQCITCHQMWEDEDGPSHIFSRDVHNKVGLGCVGCHGGDPTLEDMDEVRQSPGYRGIPTHFEIPQFCARCHSDAEYMHEHNPSLPVDQLDKYKTSVHGERLFKDRDPKVADCIDCHHVHEIADAKLPFSSTYPQNIPTTCGHCHADQEYMADYGIPTDQLSDYVQSVHGVALLEQNDNGAPACNDCHGNHGAAPPGVSSLSAVCGTCHAIEASLFNHSPHDAAFEMMDYPMCEACHGNHKIVHPTDSLVGMSESAVCTQCHFEDDGTQGPMVADSIHAALTNLVAAHDRADSLLNIAQEKGMMTRDEAFLLKDVSSALVKARTLVHAFSLDTLVPKVEEGLAKADSVQVRSANLIDEYYFRRKGLGIASLIITILVIGLWIKIRRLG